MLPLQIWTNKYFYKIVVWNGGGEGSRTPVRNLIHIRLSERSLFFVSHKLIKQTKIDYEKPQNTLLKLRQTLIC